MKVNFGMDDIVAYTRQNFDVIPVDIWGVDEVTDMQELARSKYRGRLRDSR